VVITGDLVDSKAALSGDMFAPFKELKKPTYFVYGNHDVYVGLDEVIKKLRENNVTVLQNEVLDVNNLKLIGLNYMKADDSVYDPHQVTDETIKDTLPNLDFSGDSPKVVLHHGPWGVEYMNEHKVDLVLAGHTHGGQLFPFNLIANRIFTYNKGLAQYRETYVYVSTGIATYGPVMRLGTDNEISFITLVKSN
jgi:predicted MPP superfamily phosphohydrolase